MEEIFFLPGPQGRAPSVDSLSADGLWAFVRWSPLETADDGTRKFVDDDASRLVRTDVAVAGEGVGESARELFRRLFATSAEDKSSGPRRAWSKRGHRLALARDGELWLADAPTDATLGARTSAGWTAKRLYAAPPKDSPEPRLARIGSFGFSDDDAELIVDDGKETYAFPLPRALDDVREFTLADARCLTRELVPDTGDVELDRERRVAFSAKSAFSIEPAAGAGETGGSDATGGTGETGAGETGAGETGAGEPAPDGHAEAPRPRKGQILFVDDARTIELAGFADIERPEDVSLSPDGRFVVAEIVDRTDEPARQIVPDYLTTRVTTREARRDRADDRPSPRDIELWSTDDGARRSVDLGEAPTRITRHLGWSKDPAHGALYVFTRTSEDWKTFEIWRWTPDGVTRLFADHDPAWYDGPAVGARWSGDGSRLIVGSEATERSATPGRCQLFSLDPATGLLRQLTNVRGEVDEFDVAADGSLAYLASDGDPTRRVLGFCNRELVRGEPGAQGYLVPTPTGRLSAVTLADDGSRALFRHHTLGAPAELWSVALREGAQAVQLSRTAPRRYVERRRVLPEVVTATSRDGSRVWSHVYLPRSTSLTRPDRRRPCVVFIHGAGYLQNVTDSLTEYEPNFAFHGRLAERGYVVVDVDYRGSAGYGQRFRGDVHKRLGELELEDIHAVLDLLARRGVIARDRVGCYGGSYGGFLVLMALFKEPSRWKCGAALRSVTDWRSYHPSYTQPRLGRPSEDEEAYRRSSPIDLAEGLADPLLLLHGMQDSNVFVQDTVRLMERLIDLGKEFDAMLYPSQDHAFTDGRHWVDEYRRIERLMARHLGEP
ncbi:MAG: prolyl oligopeptidase family serine peptidase [Planctomycetes bacterium]|nr:prolyl oligopeptidase family serine peptidase [Planctomycetota bacterium]